MLIFGGVGQEEEEEEEEEEDDLNARTAEGTKTPALKKKKPSTPSLPHSTRRRLFLNDVASLVVAADGTCSWSRDDDPSFIAATVAKAARSAVAGAGAGAMTTTTATTRKRKEPAAEQPLVLHHPNPLAPRAAQTMVLVYDTFLFVAGGYGERERGGRERAGGGGGGTTTAQQQASSSSSSSYPSDVWRLGPLPRTAAQARASLKAAEEEARKRAREAERNRLEQEEKRQALAAQQNGVWKTTRRGRTAVSSCWLFVFFI